MKREPYFKTEAEMCAAFLGWLKERHPEIRAYSEWWGWDILLVYPEGWQLGIQAKLRLNADVIGQAVPDSWSDGEDLQGPDFRGVLVPEERGPLAAIAHRLGLVVITALTPDSIRRRVEFSPDLMPGPTRSWHGGRDLGFVDWNPARRHDLPPVETDAVAGSPCPVTLTHWKLGALDVLAELAVRGSITAKRIKELGISPSRWLSARWVEPHDTRGLWVRGERCPRFDEQHPAAYAAALEKARAAAGAIA